GDDENDPCHDSAPGPSCRSPGTAPLVRGSLSDPGRKASKRWIRASAGSGEGEEELLHRGLVLLAHPVARGEALAHTGGDDGEAGTVERAVDRGELVDHLAAVATLLDEPDDAAELSLRP